MKSKIKVPVIVRRQHRPEWGPIKYCIYLIVYNKNRITPNGALYVGRFKDIPSRPTFCIGSPYVGTGIILERLGLKLKHGCTYEDLLCHIQFIDHIECWYCEEKHYKSRESLFIRHFAQTCGISPLVLQHSESNSFTRSLVRPDGLLLNCCDNGCQQLNAESMLDFKRKAGSKGGSKGGSKAATNAIQTRKSSDGYRFSESGLESLRQKHSRQLVNGKIPPVFLVFYFQEHIYYVPEGARSCARKATEITGIYISFSSLSQSLKRNHGDTIYKGIHFKYASLLTEDELKTAVYL